MRDVALPRESITCQVRIGDLEGHPDGEREDAKSRSARESFSLKSMRPTPAGSHALATPRDTSAVQPCAVILPDLMPSIKPGTRQERHLHRAHQRPDVLAAHNPRARHQCL